MNNLLISYEAKSPKQNNEGVTQAIQSLGDCVKINDSFWYVRSAKNAADALAVVSKACDPNNAACVVDATNEVIALDTTAPLEAMSAIRHNWNKGLA
ncbi:MAG: hypothetical protein OXE98_03845 [Hyphomicrobiales bacterium]|nr:hypothetical protein [Hyphomicrobiales bacterium]